jgi:ligand-binding sensor domain-containing protein
MTQNISVLYEDHAKNIWIGTYDNGLYKCNLEKQEIHHYNKDKD